MTATKEIFPASKNDVDSTIDAWMVLFGGKDIMEAIKDLHYEEQVKPKQLAWDVKRTDSLHQKIMDMATGKTDTKEYLQELDISNLVTYARQFFPDISHELVLKNFTEFTQGLEQQDRCFVCRTIKQVCDGWLFKHWLDSKTGYVSNQMAKCKKNIRQDRV